MPGISFFAKRAFTNVSPTRAYEPGDARRGHLLRVSSMIRADQMAERLGARLNPESDYEQDTCIYVKPHVKPGDGFEFHGRAWLDIIDGWDLRTTARASPHVGVIACSTLDGEILRREIPNQVVVIPQHHCNFERAARERSGVTRVGCIGTEGAWKDLPAGLEEALSKRGVALERFSQFWERQDIIDFYRRIDIQIVWRPGRKRLANPLKLVNAASFGVPTIALREPYFDEFDGAYLPVATLAEFLSKLDELCAAPLLYDQWAQRARERAEAYHIDRIAEKYRSLE